MPPKRNPNKKKLEKQRKKLEKQRKKFEEERKKRKEKMAQMADIRERTERNLRRFKEMELQIEIDKRKQENQKFNDLKVASRIAEALNKKDKDDDDFSADAIRLLQELEPMKEEKEEEGISIGKLQSALRKNKVEKRKKNKDLLMKGKLKIWGDSPPSDLNFDGKLRRHGKGGRRTRKKRGKGSRPNSPQQEFIDRTSPRLTAQQIHARNIVTHHETLLNKFLMEIWINKKRKVYKLIQKKANSNDDVVKKILLEDFNTIKHMYYSRENQLISEARDFLEETPRMVYGFWRDTLTDCFEDQHNINFILKIMSAVTSEEQVVFLYLLKFLHLSLSIRRKRQKLIFGIHNVDPIESVALLAILISQFRIYIINTGQEVPDEYNILCNNFLDNIPLLKNINFKNWQGGKNKTRKKSKKRKNRKKTRK